MDSKQANNICYYCGQKFQPSDTKVQGLHAECFLKWFELPEVMAFQDLDLKHQDNATQDPNQVSKLNTINASFFQGKFKKYGATLNNQQYILKVQQPEFPELPAIEYLCNRLATILGIRVPTYYFIQLENAAPTFVVKNFINKMQSGNLIHIYHYLKKRDDFNCQTLLHIIQEQTGRREDVIHFIHMCLFDALIGNDDRHGRNLGLIQTVKGLTLAPMYDNPSYLAIEEEWLLEADFNPTGKIATKNAQHPGMEDYIIEFERLGYKKIVRDFKKRIRLEVLFSEIECNIFVSKKRKEAIKRLILKRHKEMSNE
jgi:hypothetical protein